jgi:chromate transporter
MSNNNWSLLEIFVPVSLLSFGGGTAVTMVAVQTKLLDTGLLTASEFVTLVALSRFVPGPGSMIGPMAGWTIAGPLGAIMAAMALIVPSSIVCYSATILWKRADGHPFMQRLQGALAPVSLGLMFVSVHRILETLGHSVTSWAVCIGAALLALNSDLPEIILIACGGTFVCALTLLTPML